MVTITLSSPDAHYLASLLVSVHVGPSYQDANCRVTQAVGDGIRNAQLRPAMVKPEDTWGYE